MSTNPVVFIHYKIKLNFWKDPTQINVPVDVMVPHHVQNKFEQLVQGKGMNFNVTIPDVKKYELDNFWKYLLKKLFFSLKY